MEGIALVVSEFNPEITSIMEKAAKSHAQVSGCKFCRVVHVTGVFEIPLVAKRLLKQKSISGLVVLGAVIRGKTWHDVIVASSAASKLLDLSLEFDKPVGMGIMGPRATWRDAKRRASEYSKRAVEAVLRQIFL
ncbi:6,7-dimethyl-8-ribityllumazine synthase [Candidatus Woesearchaeota archaeon]|nr:6,7-dimethyl-8-ribityllumazine synthase [Candidatus Woesearchaeota archaeon]